MDSVSDIKPVKKGNNVASNEAKKLNAKKCKEFFIDNFKKTLCNISMTLEITGTKRKTYQDWYLKDDKFRNEIDECKENVKDFVENSLMKLIKDGCVPATLFYLKCKAKDRGYTENDTLEYTQNKIDKIEINIVKKDEPKA